MGVAEHILMFQGASKAKLKYETYNPQYKILYVVFFQGLCGTFSGNQFDDFITPDGDIEDTPTGFANK